MQRRVEYFEQVWNRTSITDNAVFEEIPQQPSLDTLAASIQLEEVKTAIKALKNGKAPGADSLAPEIFMYAGPDLVMCLHIFLKPSGQQRQFLRISKMLPSHTYASAKVTGRTATIIVDLTT